MSWSQDPGDKMDLAGTPNLREYDRNARARKELKAKTGQDGRAHKMSQNDHLNLSGPQD